MTIEQKYFPTDKNYFLKTVQAFSKEMLLNEWTEAAFNGYMKSENPMGLMDDFTLSLKEKIGNGKTVLDEVYDILAAIYRHKNGDNQLSFMWDGRTHMDFYDDAWKATYRSWIDSLCLKPEIYRAIVKAAVSDNKMNSDFLKASIRRTIFKTYKVKVTRSNKLHSLSA